MRKYILFIILCFIGIGIALGQSDSTDYFPLRVGNSWMYQYQNFDADYNTGGSSDSGLAQYSILSNINSIDSTIWILREVRNIVYKYRSYFPPMFDTSYLVNDTSLIQLVEYHNGNHRIARIGYWYHDWKPAFPFGLAIPDTNPFYRYYDSFQDTINVLNAYGGWSINATFQKNIGVINMGYSYNITGYSQQSYFVLKNYIITSVKIGQPSDLPNSLELSQNYPNPFNPMTTISFKTSKQSRVKVSIYNVLGRLVSSVYDGVVSAGNHNIQWNAFGQSSGIYFCKVEVNGNAKLIKLDFIK